MDVVLISRFVDFLINLNAMLNHGILARDIMWLISHAIIIELRSIGFRGYISKLYFFLLLFLRADLRLCLYALSIHPLVRSWQAYAIRVGGFAAGRAWFTSLMLIKLRRLYYCWLCIIKSCLPFRLLLFLIICGLFIKWIRLSILSTLHPFITFKVFKEK